MIDPVTLIALFGPLIKSGGQALINKFAKGEQYKPANLDDAIKLMAAETEQLKVRISAADTTDASYPWVAALVKLQRPVIVYGTITGFMILTLFSLGTPEAQKVLADLSSMVIFWLFGERTMMHQSKQA
jgi:hypothetical protein